MFRNPAEDVVFELVDNDVFRGIQNRRGAIRLIVHVALKPAQDFPFLGSWRVWVYRKNVGFVAALGVDDIERLVSDDCVAHRIQESVVAKRLKCLREGQHPIKWQHHADVHIER